MAMENKRASLKPSSGWWGKALLAGVLGALMFGAYEMLAAAATRMGLWRPITMIGATFEGLEPASQFEPGAVLMGIVLHLTTGAFWGLAYGGIALLVPSVLRSVGGAVGSGLVYGIAVWLVMGLFIGPIINPALKNAEPISYFLGHLVYGIVTGVLLYSMAARSDFRVASQRERPPEEPLHT